MTTAIEVRGLRKSYGHFEAVRGVDFEVSRGEVLALLGPNGAGKTTTVEILEGYRRRDAGEVSVLGFDPERGGREFRRKIGIVLQECAIDPHLSVREVLQQRATFYPSPRDPAEIVEMIGLSDKYTAKVRKLSGGLQRRLDLALALVGNPEVIFLDEPTTGFDPSARRESWEIVRHLCSEGRTVLLTTHYMDEAHHLADHVAIIARGRIVAAGTPDSLGGRDRDSTTVRFALPTGASLSDLPVPASSERRESTTYAVVETADPTGVLHRLTSWAVERGAELSGLTVTRPSLEDTYLRLTAEDAADMEVTATGEPGPSSPVEPIGSTTAPSGNGAHGISPEYEP